MFVKDCIKLKLLTLWGNYTLWQCNLSAIYSFCWTTQFSDFEFEESTFISVSFFVTFCSLFIQDLQIFLWNWKQALWVRFSFFWFFPENLWPLSQKAFSWYSRVQCRFPISIGGEPEANKYFFLELKKLAANIALPKLRSIQVACLTFSPLVFKTSKWT